MKVDTKRASWLLFLIMLAPVGLGIWLGLSRIYENHRRRVATTVQTVLAATREGLSTWARHTEATARSWAGEAIVQRAVLDQLELGRDGKLLRDSFSLHDLRRALQDVIHEEQFKGFDVIAQDGTDIASDRDELVATDTLNRLDPNTIIEALRGSTLIGPPFEMHDPHLARTVPTMLVATPVRNAEGAVVAALAFRIDPGQELSHIAQTGRAGETGETYVFDPRGRLVTESRFEPLLRDIGLLGAGQHSSLTVELRDPGGNMMNGFVPAVPRSAQPLTRMAASAITGQSGFDVDGYRDYRGVDVVGAWVWAPELGMGLATEVDKDEAYDTFTATRRILLSMFLLGLSVTLLLMFLLQRRAEALAGSLARARELRGQLEERVKRLQQMEEELKNAVRAREEFLRFASHELRTPLTSLRLLYESMLRSRPEGRAPVMSDADVTRFLKISTRELSRMTQVINNMFVVSSFAAGRGALNLERVDLDELVRNVVRKMHDQIAVEGATVDIQRHGPVYGYWDRNYLEQLFVNLLSNAARFGAGQPITVSIGVESGNAVVSVQDRGCGIARDEQEKIFEPFRRPRDAHSGLGVGLFVCRAIAEAHRGTITVSSDRGMGATFRVLLPLPPENDHHLTPPSSRMGRS